jgi:hypothetical protein
MLAAGCCLPSPSLRPSLPQCRATVGSRDAARRLCWRCCDADIGPGTLELLAADLWNEGAYDEACAGASCFIHVRAH